MSGVDSEQDKQPISSVNGQTSDNGTVSPLKDGEEEHATSTEGLKGTAETETTAAVSCQSEATEPEKEGDKDETKDSQSPEIITNGEPVKGHENGEVSQKAEESSVVENKPDETAQEVLDSKQVNDGVEVVGVENEVTEAEKEVEKAAEESIPEKSNGPAATAADGEQNEVETALGDVEKPEEGVKEGVKVDDKQTEKQSENQPSEESKVSVTGKGIHVS